MEIKDLMLALTAMHDPYDGHTNRRCISEGLILNVVTQAIQLLVTGFQLQSLGASDQLIVLEMRKAIIL